MLCWKRMRRGVERSSEAYWRRSWVLRNWAGLREMGWVVGRRDFSGGREGCEEVFAVMVAVAYWRGRRVVVAVVLGVRRREVRAAREGRCSRGGMVGNLFWGGVLGQLRVLGGIGIVTYGGSCVELVNW